MTRDVSRRYGWTPEWHATLSNICWVPPEAEGDEWCDMCSGWYWQDHFDGLNGPYGSVADAWDAYQSALENDDA